MGCGDKGTFAHPYAKEACKFCYCRRLGMEWGEKMAPAGSHSGHPARIDKGCVIRRTKRIIGSLCVPRLCASHKSVQCRKFRSSCRAAGTWMKETDCIQGYVCKEGDVSSLRPHAPLIELKIVSLDPTGRDPLQQKIVESISRIARS